MKSEMERAFAQIEDGILILKENLHEHNRSEIKPELKRCIEQLKELAED